MSDENRLVFKIISLLLHYPDESLMRSLEAIQEVTGELSRTGPKAFFPAFLSHLRNTPLVRLQEDYTRVFDLNPSTSLNLTYHRWGDRKERGEAMATLNHLYKSAGYESLGTDLPDYLPMLLEFLSVCPQECTHRILNEFKSDISALGSRLQALKSQYAGLFQVLQESFTDCLLKGEKRHE